uniref:F-box domain-containing protein n=1 Tax=Strongyloides papillosus TaxID=174720 RepID=A0A0N5BQR7_STREA
MEDLDLLSLPPEILANIFSNIPWNQLINVKLTARKFKYVTEKYHKNMQKPSLFTIFLSNDFTHNDGIDRIHITYSILKTDVDPLEDVSEEKDFFMPSSQLDQLHSFLQKFNDITFLDKMGIFLDNHTNVTRIFGDYLHNDFGARNVYVFTWNCEKDLGHTLSLLQKLQ